MGLMRVSLIQSKINILEKQQRFKSANQLYRTMVKLKDSLLNAENSRQIAEMQTRFETEKKQQQIEALELKNENEALTRRIYGIALILLLAISTMLAGWMRYRNKKQEELRLQEKKLADEKLQRAMDQLESYTKQLIERTHREARLQQDLERLKSELDSQSPDSDENIESLMESTLLTDDEWHSFKKLFQQVYPGFFVSLRKNYPDLTATEERLLALTRLSLQNREVARMLGISVDSVKKSKYRLRKKLHMNTDQLQEMVEEL
jgi:DNA-binding CsgD family transcriptional regulator